MALGLTSGPRAMTLARTAALTRTAVTLAAMTVWRVAGEAGSGLDRACPREHSHHVGVGVVGREQARPREQQRVGRFHGVKAFAGDGPERDLAAVEPAERQSQPEALGEQLEVVGGVGEHVAAILRRRDPDRVDRHPPYRRQVAMRCGER